MGWIRFGLAAAAWEARTEARLRELRGHIARITAELQAKRREA